MQVHTLISSGNGPIILWVMYPHRGDELEHTADSIRELVGEEQFTLVAIQIDDWNRYLSPWRSDEVDGSFAGRTDTGLYRTAGRTAVGYSKPGEQTSLYHGIFACRAFCTLGNVPD